MSYWLALVVVGSVVALLYLLEFGWDWRRSGRMLCEPMPRPYRDRQPSKAPWQQRFDGSALDLADAVLTRICNAFMFNPDHRYRFAPDDTPMAIYRRRYPHADSRLWWWSIGCDAMEIEDLIKALEAFAFRASDWREDLTIAGIVDVCSERCLGVKAQNDVTGKRESQ